MILPLEVGVRIPEDDPLHTFLKVVEGMNLRRYVRRHSGRGRHGYDPVRMLEIILFAYMNQIYSLRQMEHACRTDLRFLYLTGEETPSFQTIGQFITKNLKGTVEDVFTDLNRRIFELDGICLDELYVDGTNYEANANKYSFVWKKTALKSQEKEILRINEKLGILEELFAEYGAEVRPVRTSEEAEKYLAVLDAVMKEVCLEKKYGKGRHKTTLQRYYDQLRADTDKLRECEKRIRICGEERNSYSKTDPDATFLHMKYDYYCHTGVFKPGYNVQFGISDEYISVLQVSPARTDSRTLPATLEQFRKQYGRDPRTLIADAGYGSYNNYIFCLSRRIAACVKYSTWEKERSGRHTGTYDSGNFRYEPDHMICPQGKILELEKEICSEDQGILKFTRHYRCHECGNCPHRAECTKSESGRTVQYNPILQELKENARRLLESERGKELRERRSIYSEGAFGIVKQDYEYVRIHRRGRENVRTEVTLIAIGFNLMKYHNKSHRLALMN